MGSMVVEGPGKLLVLGWADPDRAGLLRRYKAKRSRGRVQLGLRW